MSDEFRVLQLLVLPRENEKKLPLPQSSLVGAFFVCASRDHKTKKSKLSHHRKIRPKQRGHADGPGIVFIKSTFILFRLRLQRASAELARGAFFVWVSYFFLAQCGSLSGWWTVQDVQEVFLLGFCYFFVPFLVGFCRCMRRHRCCRMKQIIYFK